MKPQDDGWLVPSGGKRADFLFYDAAGLARRYPDAVRVGAGPAGAVAIVLASTDIDSAAKALGPVGVRHGAALSVPAASANGLIVSFLPQ